MVTLAVALGMAGLVAAGEKAPEPLRFNRDIQPILSDNCFLCHGPDTSDRQADLRLDDRDSAVSLGAIVPGKPAESELVARVFSDDPDTKMPPPDSLKTLTEDQKSLLKRWIAEGAAYEGHWAYVVPTKVATPAGAIAIDVLVEQRLSTVGLKLSPEADRRTLVRRLYFDLLGLPPKPERVDAFLADRDPKAYEKLVDELLALPHYGERMAIGWLDVVRFADTIGYHSDNPRNVWPYRDYVIRAFNSNKPFDQFTVEQLAGDLLPDSTREQKVGSCFNRLLLTTEEGGAQPKDYEVRMLTDRVRAVGTVWLAQTWGCCQCHDHKFDPVKQRDFYSMGSFFADIQEPILGRREAGMPLPDDQQAAELARLDAEIATWQQQLAADPKPDAPQQAELQAQLEAARKARTEREAGMVHCLISIAMDKPRTVRILPRGNWMDESGEVVQPALPAYLPHPQIEGRRLTRLDLAQWIASRENPLTARVFVNRVWKQLFGAGISRTLDDFGSQGEWPVHPALLDWLACEFMDSGWDVKHLVRTIVTSQTYKQTSVASPQLLARDPNNRLVARQGRFRLDAELVRDNALSVSGLLVLKIGGPSVRPYQPEGYWDNLNFPQRKYEPDTGENQYRRGLYTWWQRTFLHPSLLAFDAPSREECCAERTRSNIPQQALVLLNDPTYVEAARVLAARILREGGADTAARLNWAWRETLGRAPRPDEVTVVSAVLEKHRAEFAAGAAAAALVKVGLSPAPEDIPAPELAAWTSVARIILNLHETVTRS